jgi:hypothetical protein
MMALGNFDAHVACSHTAVRMHVLLVSLLQVPQANLRVCFTHDPGCSEDHACACMRRAWKR